MHRDNRCIYIWRMFVFMFVVVIVRVCGKVYYVAAVVKKSVLALEC